MENIRRRRSPSCSGLYGRNAGCPAPPVQSRTCSFSASGSLVVTLSPQLLQQRLCLLQVGDVTPSGYQPSIGARHLRATALALTLAARRRNVLVEPEEIGGIVLVLHSHEPRIFRWTISRLEPAYIVLRLVIGIQAN